jgi:hypothetical protein
MELLKDWGAEGRNKFCLLLLIVLMRRLGVVLVLTSETAIARSSIRYSKFREQAHSI